MTEAEWLASEDPDCLVDYLEDRSSDRKAMLATVACCHRIWQHFASPCSRQVIEVLERIADGGSTPDELATAAQEAMEYTESPDCRMSESGCSAAYTAAYATERYPSERLIWILHRTADQVRDTTYWSAQESRDADGTLVVTKGEVEGNDARRVEEQGQAILIRDIFGNPFRPMSFAAEWRTSTAVALASGMYESRDFGAMPILADALQDAGCDNADVLEHCRGPGPHVRGCWVVDLVLGKE